MSLRNGNPRAAIALAAIGAILVLAPAALGNSVDVESESASRALGEPAFQMTPPQMAPPIGAPAMNNAQSPSPTWLILDGAASIPAGVASAPRTVTKELVPKSGDEFQFDFFPAVFRLGDFSGREEGKPALTPIVGDDILLELKDVPGELGEKLAADAKRLIGPNTADVSRVKVWAKVTKVEQRNGRTIVEMQVTFTRVSYVPGSSKRVGALLQDVEYVNKNVRNYVKMDERSFSLVAKPK